MPPLTRNWALVARFAAGFLLWFALSTAAFFVVNAASDMVGIVTIVFVWLPLLVVLPFGYFVYAVIAWLMRRTWPPELSGWLSAILLNVLAWLAIGALSLQDHQLRWPVDVLLRGLVSPFYLELLNLL